MPRRTSFRNIALLMLVPLCGFALFLLVRFIHDQLQQRHRAPAPARHESRPVAVTKREPPPAVKPPESRPAPTGKSPAVALILDDVGFDHQPLDSAMEIDRNLSFSVLPNAPNAREFAEVLHRNGFEVMCHLPMQPIDYPLHSPGDNAVMVAMSDAEIARTTRDDIAAVPYAAGVNNHMGSAATADPRVMRSVLSAMPQGMFFIDSMTTSASTGLATARALRIRTGERRVFLDDVQTEAAVRRQLAQLAAEAELHGVAIGIGHMYPVTVKVLREQIPLLRSRGFRFVRASEAVD